MFENKSLAELLHLLSVLDARIAEIEFRIINGKPDNTTLTTRLNAMLWEKRLIKQQIEQRIEEYANYENLRSSTL